MYFFIRIPISQTAQFLLIFCVKYQSSKSSPVINFILPLFTYSATSNSCTSYLSFFPSCLVCRMCQITTTAADDLRFFVFRDWNIKSWLFKDFQLQTWISQEMRLSRFLNSRTIWRLQSTLFSRLKLNLYHEKSTIDLRHTSVLLNIQTFQI